MRIDRIEIREIALQLRERFEISSGAMYDRRILLVTVSGDGQTGWGECVTSGEPNYSSETNGTAWHIYQDFLVPALVGSTVDDARELLQAAPWVRGHRMAKAGLEMAAWDLEARRRGISLQQLIGGERSEVPVGVSIGLQKDDAALLDKIAEYTEAGYRKIKIKIKPGRDLEMLQAVRARFPEAPIMADANSAYTLDDVDRLKAFDALNLIMIEQPLAHDDFHDHAKLQAQLETPICLDESIRSAGDTRLALSIDAGRIINIKPGRVGGLRSSIDIHDLCRQVDVPVWCGGMLESGIGRAHNVALASLPGFVIPGDISESRRYWAQDIVEPEFTMNDGMMTVPTGVGIGVDIDVERIESLTVRHETFSA
jgi:O-succinylbenzoate synthase